MYDEKSHIKEKVYATRLVFLLFCRFPLLSCVSRHAEGCDVLKRLLVGVHGDAAVGLTDKARASARPCANILVHTGECAFLLVNDREMDYDPADLTLRVFQNTLSLIDVTLTSRREELLSTSHLDTYHCPLSEVRYSDLLGKPVRVL